MDVEHSIINLSAEPDWKLHEWMPRGLRADRVVFFPDACPGKSPLPTGTAVLTRQDDWRRFAISDCGCGMRLLKVPLPAEELSAELWDDLANRLRRNKGGLGDLGGGNHFLDALAPHDGGPLHILIHTGSRHESGLVDDLIDRPVQFDNEFARIVQWAVDNRAAIQREVDACFGKTEMLLDLPHNTFELLETGGVIIRKGSVRLLAGEVSVIPSHMSGDVALIRATPRVADVLASMSHGTGRRMSRRDCKPLAEVFDFASMRERVLIPTGVNDSSLRTEGPYAYRDLDECLDLLDGFIKVVCRYRVIGYMGHL